MTVKNKKRTLGHRNVHIRSSHASALRMAPHIVRVDIVCVEMDGRVEDVLVVGKELFETVPVVNVPKKPTGTRSP